MAALDKFIETKEERIKSLEDRAKGLQSIIERSFPFVDINKMRDFWRQDFRSVLGHDIPEDIAETTIEKTEFPPTEANLLKIHLQILDAFLLDLDEVKKRDPNFSTQIKRNYGGGPIETDKANFEEL